MKSGCSASSATGACSADADGTTWSQRTSRCSTIDTGSLVRVTTRTFSTVRQPLSRAASTVALSGTTLPRRQPPSAVMIILQPASLTRSRMAVSEKPPKMTEWVAPRRAQASSAMGSSGIMGR